MFLFAKTLCSVLFATLVPVYTVNTPTQQNYPPPYSYQQVQQPLVYTEYKLGDSGLQVSVIQQLLVSRGHYLLQHTGIFDEDTEAMVKAWQYKNRLRVDGIVGHQTLQSLGLVDVWTSPYPKVERWHQTALDVGWSEREWLWLSCVIWRESNGEADMSWRGNYGLLSIVYGVHAKRITALGGNKDMLFDPAFNLRVGLELVSEGQRGRPWHNSNASCTNRGFPLPIFYE